MAKESIKNDKPVVRINRKENSNLSLAPKTKELLAELRDTTKLDSDEIIYNGLLLYKIELENIND